MLLAVASAKGSPGATTTARVLASVWPTDVVQADCDPVGGDLAILGRGPAGASLDPERGLLSLAADARRGLGAGALDEHLQELDGGLRVLLGVTVPEQVTGMGAVWPALAAELGQDRERDVVADCGRIAPGTPVLPVLAAADAVLLVVRPHVEAYAHLRERLRWLETVRSPAGTPPPVGVVLVSDVRDERGVKDLGRLLSHSGLRAPVLGRVAHDTRAADVVAGRLSRSIARSLLVRSVRELVDPVRELMTAGTTAGIATGMPTGATARVRG